jgi:hypothetical protein
MDTIKVHNTHREPAASRQAEVHIVSISDIATRKDWQVRFKIDRGTVQRYATAYRSGGKLPPIKLAKIGGTLVLVDGWHRLEAVKFNGGARIEAEVIEATDQDAQWLAASANLQHGRPLKKKELRNAFRAYVRSGQHRQRRRYRSYREIADDLANNVSYSTIRNWMKADFRHIFRALAVEGQAKPEDFDPYARGATYWSEATPLGRAWENLNAALNEARSLSPEERGKLVAYAQEVLAKIEGVKAWDRSHALDENRDF